MKRSCALILVMLMLALSPIVHAAERPEYARKDPILAGALSWYVPGLGQLYSGSILKGAAFFVAEESLLLATVLTFAEVKLDVTGNVGLGLNIKSRENPDREEQRNAIIFGMSLIAVHFLNVVDAINTARKYNKKHDLYLYTDVSYDLEEKAFTLGLKSHF